MNRNNRLRFHSSCPWRDLICLTYELLAPHIQHFITPFIKNCNKAKIITSLYIIQWTDEYQWIKISFFVCWFVIYPFNPFNNSATYFISKQDLIKIKSKLKNQQYVEENCNYILFTKQQTESNRFSLLFCKMYFFLNRFLNICWSCFENSKRKNLQMNLFIVAWTYVVFIVFLRFFIPFGSK